MKIFVNAWKGIMKVEMKESRLTTFCTGLLISCFGIGFLLLCASSWKSVVIAFIEKDKGEANANTSN